ncbi:hypothetical protein VNO80_26467 [Phaseolus coccineus]|uniref:Uncharacterized protein n=1 Tax=Phaseolus coccineus TaxID=3886 RepID=A0AAN9LFP2_PHACN
MGNRWSQLDIIIRLLKIQLLVRTHFLKSIVLFLFPLYMQPEPPEVALCLGVIPGFVLVYATMAWRTSGTCKKGYFVTISE